MKTKTTSIKLEFTMISARLLLLILFVCSVGVPFAQNQAPQISNFNLSITGNVLTIQYDLFDFENDDVNVSLHVKNNEEITYSINTSSATGDLNMVTPGTDKSIEWNFADELTYSTDYTIKLVADDMAEIDIQSIVNQVDSNNLKSDLEFIEGIRHRLTGPVHLQETRDFIVQRFTDYGLNSTIQDFDLGTYTGKNYIGTKTGTIDDEYIYICDAHYDSQTVTPGADDNGSGVVGFLEAARILSNYNFKKTIKFIGFDLEEAGLYGSNAFVQENVSPEEQIAGVLNFEMIGYYTEEPNTQSLPAGFDLLFPIQYAEIENDSFRGNFIGNFGVVNQNDWELAFDNAAEMYVPELKVITFVAPENWEIVAPDLGRSDHGPFWKADHPAVMLTGTAEFRNPNYHLPGDTIGTLNFTFMSNVVKAAVATLAEEAVIHNSSFVEEIIYITITSITENGLVKTLKAFPNPVKDIATFSAEEITSFELYDLMGKLIMRRNSNTIDMTNLNLGIYFVIGFDKYSNPLYKGKIIKK
ncbi:MAG TPA: M28 family peptidase [Bacteroidales bacterium]|nr:M28 family peptidase [Bacteroidales bacterium]